MNKSLMTMISGALLLGMFASCGQKDGGAAGDVPSRGDIAEEYRWNLEDLYPDTDAWEADFKTCESMIGSLEPFRGKLGESGKTILKCLTLRDELDMKLDKLYVYANLSMDTDTRSPEFQALTDRISSLQVKKAQATAFIVPELQSIPQETLEKYLKKEKGLRIYVHYFDNLNRYRPHILSAEMEELLAMAGDMAGTAGKVHEMLTVADIKFPKVKDEDGNMVELSPGRYYSMLSSKDPDVRRGAFEGMYGTYEKFQNINAAAFDGTLKKDIFYAKARNFNSTLEASLFANNIPVSVYDNLIETVHNNLEPLHRYLNLRKKVLGLDKLHLYDTSTPIVPASETKIAFDDARKLVLKSLKPLGKDYMKRAEEGLYGRWIDVYETKGKTNGAYSWGTYNAPHPYILLNYNDTRDNMFTLAHELGHTMHSSMTNAAQPYISSDYSLFVAEVASTMNENLLMNYLLENTDDPGERLALLDKWADNILGTLYTQVLFAEFEKAIHEKAEAGVPITARTLNETYFGILESYYGGVLELDELYKLTWGRIGHFYRQYYVYVYATSISASTYLSGKILDGDRDAIDAYMNMLRSGGADYPINLLKSAGVDMSKPDAVEYTLKKFDSIVAEMEQLLLES